MTETTDQDAISGLGLIPEPNSVERGEGWFEFDDATALVADDGGRGAAAWLRRALGLATGLPLAPRASDQVGGSPTPDDSAAPATTPTPTPNTVELRTDAADLDTEGYRLTVSQDRVLIESGGPAGAFYGAQTLRALLPVEAYRAAPLSRGPWRVPCVTVADRPRFGWRGVLLDVARHFLPKPELLRFIDLIALHKLNVLHLHLTDDQGWRVEIRKYPKLTETGAWRRESPLGERRLGRFDGRPHGGFYSQDDLREIVAYAAERHVTVVPEIDLPGHMAAAIAAYPELGNVDVPGRGAEIEVWTNWGITEDVLNAEEATLRFVLDVLDELLEIFPSRFIGVGGDECPPTQWEQSPAALARIAELGLASADGVRGWYVARLGEHLRERGRRLYGWDEIVDLDIPADAVVASWRSVDGALDASRRGNEVVLCPQQDVYLDYRQSELPGEPTPVGTVSSLAHVHACEPIPEGMTAEQEKLVLGAQCNIWTEYIDSPRKLDYMAFPRIAAFAETVWGKADRDYESFLRRLTVHEWRLDALGVEYRHADGPLPWQQRPDAPGHPR